MLYRATDSNLRLNQIADGCRFIVHDKCKPRHSEMTDVYKTFDQAVHSDFLIHWTGKDIDDAHDKIWKSQRQSKTEKTVTDLYLRRLEAIVTYGLWMTDDGDRNFRIGTREIIIPGTPKCCFTELKLSESRRHANLYGRLGIGVKRPFLFDRFGRPLAYFGYKETNHKDKFLEACAAELTDKRLLNFFKPMDRDELTYDLYSESEWRILFFDDLLKSGKIKDPGDSANKKEHAYFNSLDSTQQKRLKYLVPLDGWFAMIIYPSLPVKNGVQCNM
jgi:hypothetical protein